MDFDAYSALQIARMKDAQRLTTMTVSSFRDDDDRITGLTRDGEMSLTVLPISADGCLLDKQRIAEITERELAEALNLAATPAPASWKNSLRDCRIEKEGPLVGYLQLVMAIEPDGSWKSSNGQFAYSQDFGLEKRRNEPA